MAFVRDHFSSQPKPGDAFTVPVMIVEDGHPQPTTTPGAILVYYRYAVLDIERSLLLKHGGWRFCGVSVDPIQKELVRVYLSRGKGSTAGGGSPAGHEDAAAAADAVGLTMAGGAAPAAGEEAAAAADAVGLTTAGGGAPAGQEEAAAAADAVELTAVRLVLRCWVHALCVNVCKGSGCT
jgi:hypothetical protein